VIDPYFLQKLFKLPKIETRMESMVIDPDFPDTAANHLIKSAFRRGLDRDRIAEGLGIPINSMTQYLETFGIRPRLKYRYDLDHEIHLPLIVTWPEVGSEGEWIVDLPEGGEDPSGGYIVHQEIGEGRSRILITSDPALLLSSGFKGGVVFVPKNSDMANAVLSAGENIGRVEIYSVREK
jgi:hypothetical protein